jgi:ABC-type polysaccharide/polyol phosphate export permease
MSIMPSQAQAVLKLNPIYYIVQGYRDAFVEFEPFWADAGMGAIFWAFTAVVFVSGATIFRKLKPHFDDVL